MQRLCPFRFLSGVIVIAASLTLIGCTYSAIPERERLYASAKYEQALGVTEAQIKASGHASSAKLTVLCLSYARVKRYDRLFECADLLEQNIKRGDTTSTDLDELARESPILGGMARSKFAGNKEMLGDITYLPHYLRAEAYIDLAKYPQAVQEAKKAYFFVDRQAQIGILGTLGLAFALNGDKAQALQMSDRLSGLSIANPVMKASRNFAVAKIHVALNDFGKALEEIRKNDPTAHVMLANLFFGAMMSGQSMAVYEEIPRKFMLSKCLMETGDVSAARLGYDALLEMPQIRENGDIYWMILFDRGKIAERDGDSRNAIDLYDRAVEVIEQQRSTINTESSKIGFVGDKQALYFQLIQVLLQQKQYEKAFEYVERAKSRALVDLLASKKDFAVRGSDQDAVRAALAADDAAEAEAVIQNADLDKSGTRNLRIKARKALRDNAPELASFISVTSQPIGELLAALPEDETLVEYYYQGNDMFAFILDHERLQAVRLDANGLAAQVQNLRKALEDPLSPAWQQSSHALYQRLWLPIENRLAGRNVIVVPHGVLHYLPFAALQDNDGKFVIDRFAMRFMPSASVLRYLRQSMPKKAAERLFVLGNPDLGDPALDLQFAGDEARQVAALFPESQLLSRKDASKSNFRKFAPLFTRIHFATHGKFQADEPLKSGLYLAKGSDNDGVLTVSEIYSTNLDADLVTLSACETGLGKITNGDDVVGLTRGFLYAGSRSIVASLWSVDDKATSALMAAFYRNMASMDKRQALRQAQMEARKHFPQPFFWAAFQLTGRAD